MDGESYEYKYDNDKLKQIITPDKRSFNFDYRDTTITYYALNQNKDTVERGYYKLNSHGVTLYQYKYDLIKGDTIYYEYLYLQGWRLLEFSTALSTPCIKRPIYSQSYSYIAGNIDHIFYDTIKTINNETVETYVYKHITYTDKLNKIDWLHNGINLYGVPTVNLMDSATISGNKTTYKYKYDSNDRVIKRVALIYNNNILTDSSIIQIEYLK